MEKEINFQVHLVISNLPATESKLDKIREATKNDKQLRDLKETIQPGWPERRSQVTISVQEYWNIRDELSVIDDIIFKSD